MLILPFGTIAFILLGVAACKKIITNMLLLYTLLFFHF
jgi:hypothetical protein